MTYVHQCSKMNFFFVFLCFHLLSAVDFFTFFIHCGLCIRYFHRLWHRDELVHQILMRHRSKTLTCNVIFMILGQKIPLFVVDSCGSTIQLHSVLVFFSDAISGFATTVVVLGCLLHGMVGAKSPSNYFFTFLRISLDSSSFESMK